MTFRLLDANDSQRGACNRTIGAGDGAECTISTAGACLCQVILADGGTVTTRRLACIVSAQDSDGTTVSGVPVDRKLQQ